MGVQVVPLEIFADRGQLKQLFEIMKERGWPFAVVAKGQMTGMVNCDVAVGEDFSTCAMFNLGVGRVVAMAQGDVEKMANEGEHLLVMPKVYDALKATGCLGSNDNE